MLYNTIIKKIKEIDKLLEYNKEYVDYIVELNLVIRHKGENILVTKENIAGVKMNEKILINRKKELEYKIKEGENRNGNI